MVIIILNIHNLIIVRGSSFFSYSRFAFHSHSFNNSSKWVGIHTWVYIRVLFDSFISYSIHHSFIQFDSIHSFMSRLVDGDAATSGPVVIGMHSTKASSSHVERIDGDKLVFWFFLFYLFVLRAPKKYLFVLRAF